MESNEDSLLDEKFEKVWEAWEETFKSPVEYYPIKDTHTRHSFILSCIDEEWNSFTGKQKLKVLSAQFGVTNFSEISLVKIKGFTCFVLYLDRINIPTEKTS